MTNRPLALESWEVLIAHTRRVLALRGPQTSQTLGDTHFLNDSNRGQLLPRGRSSPKPWLDSVLGHSLTTPTNNRLTVYHLPTTANDRNSHRLIQAHQTQQQCFIPHQEEAELQQTDQQA